MSLIMIGCDYKIDSKDVFIGALSVFESLHFHPSSSSNVHCFMYLCWYGAVFCTGIFVEWTSFACMY